MAFLGDDGVLDDVSDEDVERTKRGPSVMLESGWYRVALDEDDAQMQKWGVGLSMTFRVLQGTYEGAPIRDYLCVRHSSSEKAEQIARAKLKAFAMAAGAKNPDDVRDTDPLKGKPVMVRVYREEQKGDQRKYADEDGCKARIGSFLSVAEWKAEHSDEYLPGISPPRDMPPSRDEPQPPPKDEEPPSPDDDDIPF